jgi:hypothetical protein
MLDYVAYQASPKTARRTSRQTTDRRTRPQTPSQEDSYCDGNGLYLVVDDSGAKRWDAAYRGASASAAIIGLGSVRLVSAQGSA